MLRLQCLTPALILMLSHDVQADIKMLWPSYKAFIEAGSQLTATASGVVIHELRKTAAGKFADIG